MNCIEIIKDYLTKNGFDGLAGEECGCELDDLVPCDCENILECVPAKKVDCNNDPEIFGCDGNCHFHMIPAKEGE